MSRPIVLNFELLNDRTAHGLMYTVYHTNVYSSRTHQMTRFVCGGEKIGEGKNENTVLPMDKVKLNDVNHGGN